MCAVKGSVERSLLPWGTFLIFTRNRPSTSEDHFFTLFLLKCQRKDSKKAKHGRRREPRIRQLPPWTTKKNHHRDSWWEERCSTCDIVLDQARSAQASPIRDCPRLLPCADRAWSSMISHVEQRSSRHESRWRFLFFVQGSMIAAWSGCGLQLALDARDPVKMADYADPSIVTAVQSWRRCRSFSFLHHVVVTSALLALSSGPLLLSEGVKVFVCFQSVARQCAPAFWVFFTGSRSAEKALGHEQVIEIFVWGTYLVPWRFVKG